MLACPVSVSVEILDDSTSLADGLRRDLLDASSAQVPVAFAKTSGLRELALEDWCRSGRKLELIAGTDFALTDLELLRRMEATRHASCRVYHSLTNRTSRADDRRDVDRRLHRGQRGSYLVAPGGPVVADPGGGGPGHLRARAVTRAPGRSARAAAR
jgi:hypothetical protein